MVFTLENGLLAFALADENGELINYSALRTDPSQANNLHRIAVSAFSRFAQGVNVFDEARAYALSHAIELQLDNDEVEAIEEIYLQAAPLAALLAADRALFPEASLADLGIDIDDPEPISAAFNTFNADVGLHTAAGDLHVSSASLDNDLRELDLSLQVLGTSGKVERSDWTQLYVQSLCIVNVALENAPNWVVCE